MADKVTKTLVFKFEKETKNAVRFQEEAENGVPMIGPLYVQKHALNTLGDVKAQQIKVTIELP